MNGYRSRKGVRSGGGLAARLMRGANRLRNPVAKTTRARTVGGLASRKFTPRFATVGFSRDVEKKYHDGAIMAKSGVGARTRPHGDGADPANTDWGWSYESNEWAQYDFDGGASGVGSKISNNLVKGIKQGTTARTRIGNKVNVKYIKGTITLGGAKISSAKATVVSQSGEVVVAPVGGTSIIQYLRTTFRVVLVKDLQVNSADEQIVWDDVFENVGAGGGDYYNGVTGGVHAELKIANMGRFRILSDSVYETSAVNPQKSVRYLINGRDVGNVRYNSGSDEALTDEGVYVIWAAYVQGITGAALSGLEGMIAPSVVMNKRVCFTDT